MNLKLLTLITALFAMSPTLHADWDNAKCSTTCTKDFCKSKEKFAECATNCELTREGPCVVGYKSAAQMPSDIQFCKMNCNRLTCKNKGVAQSCYNRCNDSQITNCMNAFKESKDYKELKATTSTTCKTFCNRLSCLSKFTAIMCTASCPITDIRHCTTSAMLIGVI